MNTTATVARLFELAGLSGDAATIGEAIRGGSTKQQFVAANGRSVTLITSRWGSRYLFAMEGLANQNSRRTVLGMHDGTKVWRGGASSPAVTDLRAAGTAALEALAPAAVTFLEG